MYQRTLQPALTEAAKFYPLIGLLGPRQSGKTTLARQVFPQKTYVNLESLHVREFAESDPEGFLRQYPDGAVLDEVQRVPVLFPYLQVIADEKKREGLFVLTGSHNFSLLEKITQSLAGRIALRYLLPFSFEEIAAHREKPDLNGLLYRGGYPRIYDKSVPPQEWLGDYIATYLDRDVRLMKNVGDLSSFHLFLKMLASRSGQLINLSQLGNDCGINHNTAKAWLSVLEASFVVFRHVPYYKNFSKRLKKAHKVYFYDTGLLCHLLGIASPDQLAAHALRGPIFETFVVGEIFKAYVHRARTPSLYFWQEKLGREIDCLVEEGGETLAIEVKSGRTVAEDYFQNLQYWQKISNGDPAKSLVLYAGDEDQISSQRRVMSWTHLSNPAGFLTLR